MTHLIRLIRYARPYWGLLIITMLSLIGITAMNLIAPWMIREMTAILVEGDLELGMPGIKKLALTLAVLYIARAFFTYLYRYLSHVAAWNFVADMRVIVYNHLQKLSLRYYHDKQTGQLMSRTTNDTATFEVLIAHAVPDLITNVLILVGVTAILLRIHPTLALLTMIPVPFLLVGGWVFTHKVLPYFKTAQSTLADLNAILQDNLSGMKEIQAFNQQKNEKKRIESGARNYVKAILSALNLSAIFHPTVEMISAFGTVIVVGFGGWLALEAKLSVADIVGFLMYLGLFYQPIATLARVTEDLQQSIAGAERVFEVLDTEPDITDKEHAKPLEAIKGDVQFKHVSFGYVDNQKVLDDVSFHAAPGEMIALVGPTGVGKTTIISLLARFYDPNEGQILIDGQPLTEVTMSSIRHHVSIVLQDIFLFNGSIAENIAYGSKDATLNDIMRAAKIAKADEFIDELPEGYDTYIGERGIKLSGGQKQRLSIARAVLRDTPILILDEATASVDVETEAKIQAAIQEIAGSRTIIVIAHRLSTVKRADKILVLKEGKIVESGNHDTLLKQGGLYKQLCDIQLQQTQYLEEDN